MNISKSKKPNSFVVRSGYVKFLPLLAVYFTIYFFFSKDYLYGDEIRYVHHAENLTNGFFTNPENPYLFNGPGYPIYLAIYLLLGIPLFWAKIVNGVLVYLAIVIFYRVLRRYCSELLATIGAFFLGLYPPLIEWIHFNNTEALSVFLISAFIYQMVRAVGPDGKIYWRTAALAGLIFGYLALVKIIFAYVIFVGLVLAISGYLLFRKQKVYVYIPVLSIGALLLVPWMIYTFHLTGRVGYLSNNGGEQLYWMTTNYSGETGSWIGPEGVLTMEIPELPHIHYELFSRVSSLSWDERNDELVEAAKENIRNHPMDYLKNIANNISRLLIDYPYSYSPQQLSSWRHFLWNPILLLSFLISLVPVFRFPSKIALELILLLVLASIYIGGSVLVSAVIRYGVPVIPMVILWTCYSFSRFFRIDLVPKKVT